MITPTTGRILVKKIDRKDASTDSGLLVPGQMLQEENLLYGEIIHPSDSKFTKGQIVFYSRYSATNIFDEKGQQFQIVSDLDVMAVEDNDTTKV